MDTDLPYWLALSRFTKFGARRLKLLYQSFPTMKEAFFADKPELLRSGLSEKLVDQFILERTHLDPNKELFLLSEHRVQAITIKDPTYPKALKDIYDPPAVLFVRGNWPLPEQKTLAVVGSRRPTNYGQRVVDEIVEPLAQAGVIIVSGLAYGIDALSHQATLRSGGLTQAVLGSGVDDANIYPSQNRSLASQIMSQGGTLISEFPINTHPLRHNFPFRNRIIAGMCSGTLVIEAQEKSGSLITARCALEAGRDVFAVPGSIHSPLSAGPNNLIKMGAIPVTKPNDIIDEVGEQIVQNTKNYQPGSKEETIIYRLLSAEPQHLDELIQLSELAAPKANSLLTLMEMKGAAKHVGGHYYIKG
ncbi:DNA-processing protein DprA [Patescibacteria group bacterium]